MPRTHRPRAKTILLMSSFCVAVAVSTYTLLTAFAPAMHSTSVNATNNDTIHALARSAESPSDAQLYIPALDVNVPYSTGADALRTGAWWRKPANGNPKDGGNFVLAGHRFVMDITPSGTVKKSPFYSISRLKVGDRIIVDYKKVRYTYVIRELRTVKPNEISIEERTSMPRLTLYTCTLAGERDGRDVIIATTI